MNAGTLRSILQARVRDPVPLANTEAQYRQILSECQRLVNAAGRLVLEATPFELTPRQPLYQVQTNFPRCVRIEFIRDVDNRDLDRVDFPSICNYSRTWPSDLGDTPRSYTFIGRDTLLVYPAPRDAGITITVYYTKLLTELVDDTINTDLRDDDLLPVVNLAEIIFLAKLRKFVDVPALVKQFTDDLRLIDDSRERGIMPMP